jgi:hypothetical protein
MQSEKHAESYFMMRNSSIHYVFILLLLWPFLVVAAHAAKKSTLCTVVLHLRPSVRLISTCPLHYTRFIYDRERERERETPYTFTRGSPLLMCDARAPACVCGFNV